MFKSLHLCAVLLLSFSPLFGSPSATHYEDDFRLLTFNVFFISQFVVPSGQEARAHLIAQAPFMQNQDLIILNELFDDQAAQILLKGLQTEYPYQTSILGASQGSWDATVGHAHPLQISNGGVAILSRWPIVEKIQSIYSQGCGSDFFSKKGFVYVKIKKNDQFYHVIGTHAQSEAYGCRDATSVRASQFDQIRKFIQSKPIPAHEIVFIGGDFNVIKDTAEYQDVLRRLNVLEPNSYGGHNSSWDPVANGMAYQYYLSYMSPQYLDYIFVSALHAHPRYWHNQTLDIPSPRWSRGNSYQQEYSDHYPVSAFAFADEQTPTHSFRPENLPYRNVHFRHEASGRYITAHESLSNDWLTVSASISSPQTAFQLDNWFPAKHPFCIRSGDFIQLQSQIHPGYYWNWALGFWGTYGYYLKKGDSSNRLRVNILNDNNSCLKHGDRVYFVDKNILTGQDTHIQYWPDGRWQNHIFLKSSEPGPNEIFVVEIPDKPVYTDWSSRLKYRE